VIEHKRQMFLKKELAWVRQGPRAQRSKQKDRFERYYATAAQDGPMVEEEVELVIPPPPQLGNRTVEVSNLGMMIAGRKLFSGFNFTFENGKRVGVCGRNGLGKSTLLKIIVGQLAPTEGVVEDWVVNFWPRMDTVCKHDSDADKIAKSIVKQR